MNNNQSKLSMRKILMAAAAITLMMTMGVLTSCTSDNDDNPADDVEILVIDPLLKWGCSINDVEKHIQAKEWWADGNDKLDFWEDPFQCWHKWYYVVEDVLTEQYLFETEDGQNLRYAMCCCWDNTVPVELCKNTLHHQGFQATGNIVQFDGDPYNQYFSADGQTEALVNVDDEGYWYIIYQPRNK